MTKCSICGCTGGDCEHIRSDSRAELEQIAAELRKRGYWAELPNPGTIYSAELPGLVPVIVRLCEDLTETREQRDGYQEALRQRNRRGEVSESEEVRHRRLEMRLKRMIEDLKDEVERTEKRHENAHQESTAEASKIVERHQKAIRNLKEVLTYYASRDDGERAKLALDHTKEG